jgi:hypothetical protein
MPINPSNLAGFIEMKIPDLNGREFFLSFQPVNRENKNRNMTNPRKTISIK